MVYSIQYNPVLKFYTVYQTLYENTVIYMRIGKLKVFPALLLKRFLMFMPEIKLEKLL